MPVEGREPMKQQLKRLLGPLYTPGLRHMKRQAELRFLGKGEPELALLPKLLDRQKVAVDVGVNIGDYLGVLARCSARVIGFEPHPRCFAFVDGLNLDRCTVLNIALSDRAGTATLQVPVEGEEVTGLASIALANSPGGQEAQQVVAYEVRTMRLDDALAEQLRPGEELGFVKIDVEGHELAVLEGGLGTIESRRPIVMVETEFRHGAPVERIFALFDARGYQAKALVRGRMQDIDAPGLRRLQEGVEVADIVKDTHDSSYVNNVWFFPSEQLRLLDRLG